MSRDTDIAYLAGIIDSDGFITIQRTRKQNASTGIPQTYYALKVGISGTRTPPHELAQELFGGAIHAYTPKNAAHRTQFQWCCTGGTAVAMLRQLRPFLRVKLTQAELGISFYATMLETRPPPRSMLSAEGEKRRAAAWSQMVSLNQARGRLRSAANQATV